MSSQCQCSSPVHAPAVDDLFGTPERRVIADLQAQLSGARWNLEQANHEVESLRADLVLERESVARWSAHVGTLQAEVGSLRAALPTCPCGKPAEHINEPESSRDWACRVPPKELA